MAKREFSPLRKFFMFLEAGVILPLVYCASFLSFRRIRLFSEAVGRFTLKISPVKKQEVLENLGVIFPNKIWGEPELNNIAAQSQGYILRIFIELQKISRLGIQDLIACIRIDSASVLSALYRRNAENTPQVFLTMHAGNWELMGSIMSLLGFNMVSVVERQFNPFLDAYYQKLRKKSGINGVYNEISLMRPLVKHLRQGGAVALVADQNYWHDPIFLPFFGKEASAPRGVGGLALHTGALIAIGATQRVGEGVYSCYVHLMPPIAPRGSRDADILALTQEAYAFYEEFIYKDPANWFLLSSPRWRLNYEVWQKWAKNPDSSQF